MAAAVASPGWVTSPVVSAQRGIEAAISVAPPVDAARLHLLTAAALAIERSL